MENALKITGGFTCRCGAGGFVDYIWFCAVFRRNKETKLPFNGIMQQGKRPENGEGEPFKKKVLTMKNLEIVIR